jgi:hypothetical protein
MDEDWVPMLRIARPFEEVFLFARGSSLRENVVNLVFISLF